MKLTKLVAIALISGSVSASALMAQSQPGSQPAEFPPTSFKGKQYVDSAGCVFIRAGIDGNVSWVPRVTRKRSGVCGFKPSLAGQVSAPTPVQTAASEQITIDVPAVAAPAAVAKPVPKPRPKAVVKATPKPKPKPKVVRQVAKAPAPIVEKAIQPAAPVRRVANTAPSACAGVTGISSQYLQRGKFEVRCGPQGGAIVGARISSASAPRPAAPVAVAAVAQPKVAPAPQTLRVSPNRRIVPRHVAVKRVNTTNVSVPKGYRTVWTDDRLNPNRAEQTLAGHKAMSLIWTSTVPRRLINQADGRDVTASIPLVYPYVDYARQQETLGQVTIVKRNGQTLKRIVHNTAAVFTAQPRQAKVVTVARQPVVYSSRSTPKTVQPKASVQRAQPKAEVAGKGFVQVGAFTDTNAAHRLAKKVQRMGMPVRVGRYTRNGQTTRLVIAGPFGGKSAVNGAVKRLRGAGYSAFAR
ncbi:MAG: SPOR domain-containing protein [Sulfitobacter sp.]